MTDNFTDKKPKRIIPLGFILFTYCICNSCCNFVGSELKVELAVGIVIKEKQLNQDRLGVRFLYDV